VPPFQGSGIVSEKVPNVEATLDRVLEIERLAALDPINYEVKRAEAAEKLGVRAAVLDREVKKKRGKLGLDTDEGDGSQGRTVKIVDALPWADVVDGDQLATSLACTLRMYVALSDAAADAVALWIIYSWCVSAFHISPRLAITSPTKGCGKTTLLRFLKQVVRRPKRAGSISPAALFRVIEKHHPTILLDETEKYLEPNSDTHALLNEGHCVGGTTVRVLGEKQELREFDVFCAVAFCRNGRMPDDLAQRSIIIEMQRRTRLDQIAELREDRTENLKILARMCARWSDDNIEILKDSDPDIGHINRDGDNWKPLFAVGDLIGSDWPQRIREAAAVLVPRESESIGPMLLADIDTMLQDPDIDRLVSATICEALAAIEGRPWADWKNGKPITPNQLARLLKPFGIVPENVRVGSHVPKGYYRHRFTDAFDAICPTHPLMNRYTATSLLTQTLLAFLNRYRLPLM
jgi:Protein of unknown function (DUF3631)